MINVSSVDDFVRQHAKNLVVDVISFRNQCPECNGRCGSTYYASPIEKHCEHCLGYGVVIPVDMAAPCRSCGGFRSARIIGRARNDGAFESSKARSENCHSCQGICVLPICDFYFLSRYLSCCSYLIEWLSTTAKVSPIEAAKTLNIPADKLVEDAQSCLRLRYNGYNLLIKTISFDTSCLAH